MIQQSIPVSQETTLASTSHEFVGRFAAATFGAVFDLACSRDPTFNEHADNVANLSVAIGRRLGREQGDLELLRFAARVHDLGKVVVPTAIIAKDGPLDAEEWRAIRAHPEAGAEILTSCSAPQRVVEAVRFHHERWNGTGYPAGLAGRSIPLEARIICVADAYCAMVEPRPYRSALAPAAARKELLDHAGSQFDAECAWAATAVAAA